MLRRTMASGLGLPDHRPRVTGVTDPWKWVRKVSHVPRNLCSEHNFPASLGGLKCLDFSGLVFLASEISSLGKSLLPLQT